MYFAGYIVAGFLIASFYAWGYLRGRGAIPATALTIALTAAAVMAPVQVVVGDWAAREVASKQPVSSPRSKGCHRRRPGRPSTCSAGTTGTRSLMGSKSAFAVAARLPQPRRDGAGSRHGAAADQPPVNVVRFAFQSMVGIGTLLALLSVFYLYIRFRQRRLPRSRWFYRAVSPRVRSPW